MPSILLPKAIKHLGLYSNLMKLKAYKEARNIHTRTSLYRYFEAYVAGNITSMQKDYQSGKSILTL